MKKCPYCAEMIQDEAVKCRFCGEYLDQPRQEEPETVLRPAMAPEKLAEIRRLQRIASGRPTRKDTLRKTRGILYLVIIGAILLYSWQWRRLHRAEQAAAPDRTEITYQAFSGLFGRDSPLSPEVREQEFAHYRGRRVVWTGEVVYVNRAEGAEAYMSVRHRAGTRTSDVIVYFGEENRDQLDSVRPGSRVRYAGRIFDAGHGTGFITLKEGAVLAAE